MSGAPLSTDRSGSIRSGGSSTPASITGLPEAGRKSPPASFTNSGLATTDFVDEPILLAARLFLNSSDLRYLSKKVSADFSFTPKPQYKLPASIAVGSVSGA